MRRHCAIVLFFAVAPAVFAQPYSVSGVVLDSLSGSGVYGAHVVVDGMPGSGAVTNEYGFFGLESVGADLVMVVTHIGYRSERIELALERDTTVTIRLAPVALGLEVVEVHAGRQSRQAPASSHTISALMAEALPVLAGETDFQKTMQLMPGVQGGAEGTAGLFVRGGGADQNLILLDGTPMYNPSHLFGFFSPFHTKVIKDATLMKGDFPARYGGRLSSVMDYSMKEGSFYDSHGSATVGLIASNFTFEGPLVGERVSFVAAGRRTYIDLLTRLAMRGEESFGLSFHDLSTKFSYRSASSFASLTLYSGRDDLWAGYDNVRVKESGNVDEGRSGVGWSNRLMSLHWSRMQSPRFVVSATMGLVQYLRDSGYEYEQSDGESSRSGFEEWITSNLDWTGRLEGEYLVSASHDIRFGIEGTRHRFLPSRSLYRIGSDASETQVDNSSRLTGATIAPYIESLADLPVGIQFNTGIRLSGFSGGGVRHWGLEPRASARLSIDPSRRLYVSWATMRQYVHLLASSGGTLPTDLWISVMDDVPPQRSHQLSVGFEQYLADDELMVSVEAFRRNLNGLVAFGEGEDFASPSPIDWSRLVESGSGRAIGMELYVRKNQGRTKGWLAYTIGHVTRTFTEINGGVRFPDGFDRRHDVSVVAVHDFSPRVQLAMTGVFGSGYPIWLPVGAYDAPAIYNGNLGDPSKILVDYGPVNDVRLPPYHRIDIAVRWHKNLRRSRRTWTFGIYNAYNRHNPTYVYPKLDDGKGPVRIAKTSYLLLIPTITYSRSY